MNPQGCTVRRLLEIGAAVRLEGLAARTNVTARVVNSISLGEYEKVWLLGLALDEETPDGAAANLKAVSSGERANTEAVLKSRRFRVENISNSSGAKFLRLSVW